MSNEKRCSEFLSNELSKLISFCSKRNITCENKKTLQDSLFEFVEKIESDLENKNQFIDLLIEKMEKLLEIIEKL